MELLFFGNEECYDCLKIRYLLDRSNISYNYIDAFDEKNDTICDDYGVDAIPHILLKDDNKLIIFENIGDLSEDDFINYIARNFGC